MIHAAHILICCLLSVLLPLAAMADEPKAPASTAGWEPDSAVIADLEQKKTDWVYRESDVPAYRLPDVLLCADGSRVTDRMQWEQKRRPETLELFEKWVFGRSPKTPAEVRSEVLETHAEAMDGAATLRRIRVTSTDGEQSFAFEFAILVPNKRIGDARVPALVLLNNRGVRSADPTRAARADFWPAEQIIARGYAAVVLQTSDVDPDTRDAALRTRGVRGVFSPAGGDQAKDAWGTIAAWAWGASRVMDFLQTDTQIDSTRVGVVGHSRAGKAALWAGAVDQRFALVISNNSGCTGAALSRRRLGETVRIINEKFPYWFCENYKSFSDREHELPIDQHQLMALVAPRALYVASAGDDIWADPRGEFLSLVHAAPVYVLYGEAGAADFSRAEMPALETPLIRGPVGYHIRRGGHNMKLYDWERFLDFADGQWHKPAAPTTDDNRD